MVTNAILELFPIVIALHIGVQKCQINAPSYLLINKQTSKDKGIMIFVRSLVLCCLRFNILFHARHIPGFLNKGPLPLVFRWTTSKPSLPTRTFYRRRCQRTYSKRGGRLPESLIRVLYSEGSKKIYQHAWNVYSEFSYRFGDSSLPELPLDQASVALFISFLSASKLAPSTISSYISALSYATNLKTSLTLLNYF